MKLRDYLSVLKPDEEVTCWDKDVDSEFYFYNETDKAPDTDFVNYFVYMQHLIDLLDVTSIHGGGVEVNLYDLLDNPKVIQFAKDNLYAVDQYEEDSDVVELLFDDNVKNISNGYEHFSESMVQCFEDVYKEAFAPRVYYRSVVDLSDEEIARFAIDVWGADTVNSIERDFENNSISWEMSLYNYVSCNIGLGDFLDGTKVAWGIAKAGLIDDKKEPKFVTTAQVPYFGYDKMQQFFMAHGLNGLLKDNPYLEDKIQKVDNLISQAVAASEKKNEKLNELQGNRDGIELGD